MDELRCDFKQQMDGVKESVREIEKSLESAWAAFEDIQQESKAFKDSKRSYQEMLDKQTNLIQQLQSEMKKFREENDKLRPSLKETQEKLTALENYYKEREFKIHEHSRKTGRKLLENCIRYI